MTYARLPPAPGYWARPSLGEGYVDTQAVKDCATKALSDGKLSEAEFKACAKAAAGTAATAYCDAQVPGSGTLCKMAAEAIVGEIAGPMYDAGKAVWGAAEGALDDLFGKGKCGDGRFCVRGVHWSKLTTAQKDAECLKWVTGWPLKKGKHVVPTDVRGWCVKRVEAKGEEVALKLSDTYWKLVQQVADANARMNKTAGAALLPTGRAAVAESMAATLERKAPGMAFSLQQMQRRYPKLVRQSTAWGAPAAAGSLVIAVDRIREARADGLVALGVWSEGIMAMSLVLPEYIAANAARVATHVSAARQAKIVKEAAVRQAQATNIVAHMAVAAGVVALGAWWWRARK